MIRQHMLIARTIAAALLLLVVSGCARKRCCFSTEHESAIRKADQAVQAERSALDRIQAAKVLRIGVKGDGPPFCFQDKEGNPLGFDVDIGFRLARALGVEPLFVTMHSAERIEKLTSGQVDVVIATLTATRRRAREIDFSLPYFQDQQSLLVKSASAIQSYRDLSGRNVAAIVGTTSIDNIKVVAPDARIVPVESISEGLQKLSAGAADALTGDGLQLRAVVLGASANEFRIAGEGFSVEAYVIGLPRNDSGFRQRVDEFLTELWNSGAWNRIFNKWLGAQSAYNMEARFQMPVLPP